MWCLSVAGIIPGWPTADMRGPRLPGVTLKDVEGGGNPGVCGCLLFCGALWGLSWFNGSCQEIWRTMASNASGIVSK